MKSDLKLRTKDYALAVIRLFAELPKRTEAQIMGRQLLRVLAIGIKERNRVKIGGEGIKL